MKKTINAFTLIECLIVLALLSLFIIAWPTWQRLQDSWSIKQDKKTLLVLLTQARHHAILSGDVVGVSLQHPLKLSAQQQVFWQASLSSTFAQLNWRGLSSDLTFYPSVEHQASCGRLHYFHARARRGFELCINRFGRFREC